MKRAALCVLLPLLTACNSATTGNSGPLPPPAAPAPGATPQYVTPNSFHMPEGTGCGGEIARFEAVMGNDLATGHVARSVYDNVIGELSGARSACVGGNSGAAMSQLHAVKARHGYP